MPTADEVITRYVLDPSGYVSGGQRVAATDSAISSSMKGVKANARNIGSELAQGWQQGEQIIKRFAQTYVAVTVGGAAFGYGLMQQAAEWDALVAALKAVEPAASDAAKALKDVRELARMPGIGLSEAMMGYTQLRRAGIGQQMSRDMLREFANQVALGGGGKEELGRVMRAISQIATKPFLQGDELIQLSEARIPAYKMIKDVFGTADTEELKRRGVTSQQVLESLVMELSKVQRVAGSAKNSIENAGDAWKIASISAGHAINDALIPSVDEFSKAMEDAATDGTIKSAFELLVQDVVSVIDDGASDMKGVLRGVMSDLVTLGAAWRNITLNVEDIASGIGKAFDWLKHAEWWGPIVDVITGGGSGAQSPVAEGEQQKDFAGKLDDAVKSGSIVLGPNGEILTRQRGAKMKAMTSAPITDLTGDEAAKKKDDQDYWKQIARNTELTAKHTKPLFDMEKSVMGGGDLARAGAANLSHRKRTHIGRALTAIEEAITQAIQDTVGLSMVDYRRSGSI